MFKVLYTPFEGMRFERFEPWSRSRAVLVYEGFKGSRVLISSTKDVGTEVEMMEAAAECLNHPPSLEFTRLMLRAVKDVWQSWKRDHESKLMRTLRYEARFQTRDRQPPFAPNSGERVDGIW